MFETSFLQGMNHFFVNIIFPLLPGILFLWIFFGRKFSGMLLYLLSRFVGVGVIAFSMFNLQFLRFGIGTGEYFVLLGVLLLVFVAKLWYQKTSWKTYISSLKIKNIFPDMRHSFRQLSQIEKIFTWSIAIFGLWFVVTSFVQTTHFPTYADDSFANRNRPAYNIYLDGGVKLFGVEEEILGRARLGYPIYIPIYKATISHIAWEFNDIYINMRQWLVFFFMLVFVFTITFAKTKHIFYSLLPVGLVISLPLVFFHAGEGYMELASAAYSILTIRALWKFLETKEYDYIWLGLLLWFILSHIKNDGLLGYFAGIVIAFVGMLVFTKQFVPALVGFVKKKNVFRSSICYVIFFFVPFLFVKWYYNLWFNQSVGTEWWLWIIKVHPEIFNIFGPTFFSMDNYNTILIPVVLMIVFIYLYKKNDRKTLFLMLAPVIIFIIFVLVFRLTENYIFAMNQTTFNRVFTMAFIVLLSFTWIYLHKEWNHLS